MPRRIAIIGNAGAGKSFLAARLGGDLGIPRWALDDLFWADADYSTKRDERSVIEMLEELAGGEDWIIEGVYGELVERLIARTTVLIWVDLDWPSCQRGLVQRESERERKSSNFTDLLEYAGQYWTRDNKRSHKAHEELFGAFEHEKYRLCTRRMVSEFFLESD